MSQHFKLDFIVPEFSFDIRCTEYLNHHRLASGTE